jgi:replicative DNA helicase
LNSEFALIQLLLRTPHQSVELNRKGLRSKHFKNPDYKKAYKLIHETHVAYGSLPTTEQLDVLNIKIDYEEEIPHTIEYCLENIKSEYNKNLLKEVIKAAGTALIDEGVDAAKDIMQQSTQHLVDFEKIERSQDITALTDDFLEQYNFKAKFKGQIIGVPTGFSILDNHTMGLMPQWLVVVAGRNGQGKSWQIFSWAAHAWQKGYNVGVFSCEMSKRELISRIHALLSGVPPIAIQHGTMNLEEYSRLETHLKKCFAPPFGKLILNDQPSDMLDIEAEIIETNRTTPLDIVFIDSAYRLRSPGDSDPARQKNIAIAAKNLAKKYNIPVVVSVQLNRDFAKANETEKGKSKTTAGSHYVYGSDGFEQEADLILIINRPENYEPFHYVDLITTKFRHGSEEHYIFEMNLNVPRIMQIDRETAEARLAGAPPPITNKANHMIEQAKQMFINDIKEQDKLKNLEDMFKKDLPPEELGDK